MGSRSGLEARFVVTTTTGLEDVTASEVEKLGCRVREVLMGRVVCSGKEKHVYILNLCVKSAERVYLLLVEGEIESLRDVYKLVVGVEPWFIGKKQPFAVRTTRHGSHSFTSLDVSATVGQGVVDAYFERFGERPVVSLDYPSVELKAWVVDNHFMLGLNTTGETLSKRRLRPYLHPAPIKPSLAASLLFLSGYSGEFLLDPFCGSGTILIEAAQIFRRIHNGCFRRDFSFVSLPFFDVGTYRKVLYSCTKKIVSESTKLVGLDLFQKHVVGARLNARAAFVGDTIHFLRGDATKLCVSPPELVVTNPPYGVRIGSKKKVGETYKGFCREIKEFKGLKVVFITAFAGVEDCFQELKLLERREIMYGSLRSFVYSYLVD